MFHNNNNNNRSKNQQLKKTLIIYAIFSKSTFIDWVTSFISSTFCCELTRTEMNINKICTSSYLTLLWSCSVIQFPPFYGAQCYNATWDSFLDTRNTIYSLDEPPFYKEKSSTIKDVALARWQIIRDEQTARRNGATLLKILLATCYTPSAYTLQINVHHLLRNVTFELNFWLAAKNENLNHDIASSVRVGKHDEIYVICRSLGCCNIARNVVVDNFKDGHPTH